MASKGGRCEDWARKGERCEDWASKGGRVRRGLSAED